MHKDPLVSVVMITYNHQEYIIEALEGVFIQRCNFEYEVILANDCSTDNSDKIIVSYLNNHPKKECVKYTYHKKNKGMIPNFSWALRQSKGKYIALCEGDDYWTDPLKLQKQVDFLESNLNCSFCFTRAKKTEENNLINIYPKKIEKNILTISEYLSISSTATCSLLFRNIFNTYQIIFPKLNHSQGDFLLYCLLLHYGNAGFLKDVTCVYRKHVNGISYYNHEKNYLLNRIKELEIEKKYFKSYEVKIAISRLLIIHAKKFNRLYPLDKHNINITLLRFSVFIYNLKLKILKLKIIQK